MLDNSEVSLEVIALRLFAAAVCGLLIGWERERKNKPAGLKTHTLVCIGSATFFLIFIEFALGGLKDAEGLSPDPSRVIEGVITGIGFLGAGAFIRGNHDVAGLTTGAGIWVAGGIGLACGAGYFHIAGMVTLFTLLVLLIAGWFESRDAGGRNTESGSS